MISPKDKSAYHTKQIGWNMLQPGLKWSLVYHCLSGSALLSIPVQGRRKQDWTERESSCDRGPKIAFAGPTVSSGAKETHQRCPFVLFFFFLINRGVYNTLPHFHLNESFDMGCPEAIPEEY